MKGDQLQTLPAELRSVHRRYALSEKLTTPDETLRVLGAAADALDVSADRYGHEAPGWPEAGEVSREDSHENPKEPAP